jgi:hypothetical protein
MRRSMKHRKSACNGVAFSGGRTGAVSDDPQDMAEALRQQVAAERELSDRLGQHAGQWVAVRNHKIVAHAPTLDELTEKIRGTEDEEAAEVFEVSKDSAAVYFF